MAIKGKGKTRGRKAPAPAPRPVLVVRKPPAWKRAWVLVTVGVVVVAGILTLVFTQVGASHHRTFLDRERNAVGLYSDQIASKVPPENQSVGGGTVFLFPQLSTLLDDLSSGKTKPADSLVVEQRYSTEAQKAITDIQAINVSRVLPVDMTVGPAGTEAPGLTQATGTDAQFLMVKGLQIYQSAFAIWAQAAAPNTTDADRKALADQAKALATQAEALFDNGYTKLGQLRGAVGLAPITQFPQPSPSPTPSPTPTPSASASASGSPMPKPSGSASPTP